MAVLQRPPPPRPPDAPVDDDSVVGEEDPGSALDADETGATVAGAATPAGQRTLEPRQER